VESLRGEDAAFGSGVTGVIGRFLRNKLSPMVGTGINIAAGKNAVGDPVTPWSVAKDMVIPLSFKDIQDVMSQHGVGAGTIIMTLGTLGIGVQNYTEDKYKSAVKSFQIGNKEMKEAKTEAERQAVVDRRPYVRQGLAIANLNTHINKMESVVKILNERLKTAPEGDKAIISQKIAELTANMVEPKQRVVSMIRESKTVGESTTK
jgi:hypothetical protein